MRIKAFDLGSRCGVAGVDSRLLIQPVYFELLEPWGKPGTVRFVKDWHRWPLARAAFRNAVAGCDHVYFEMPMGVKKNRAAELVLTGLQLGLEEACGELSVPSYGVPQPSVKKFATGRGNAKKPEMIEAARRIWGLPDQALDDNVADALCLLAYGVQRQGLEMPNRPTGQENTT